MVKGLDKETIYFNFRLDIDITNFSDMDEFVSVTRHMKGNDMDKFVSVTKHMKGRESKIPIDPMRKNPKK